MLPKTELRPSEGTRLEGQGMVVRHAPILRRTTGHFYGLYYMLVEKKGGCPDVDIWLKLLPGEANVKLAGTSSEALGRLEIYYKLEEP